MDQTNKLFVQALTVVFGGLFAYVMVDLVVSGSLKYYLATKKFETLVLGAGLLLSLIVLLKIRALSMATGHHHHHHDHDHDHGHSHDHGHAHDHSHGDDHSHEVSLWRFFVLMFPLVIVLMKLTPKELSDEWIRRNVSTKELTNVASKLPNRKVDPNAKRFLTDPNELQTAARDGLQRRFWESDAEPIMARISGQFIPGKSTDRFRLMRIKMTCCSSDSTPIDATVVGEVNGEWKYGDWLEVDGPVAFVESNDARGGQQYFPVVYMVDVRRTGRKEYIQ